MVTGDGRTGALATKPGVILAGRVNPQGERKIIIGGGSGFGYHRLLPFNSFIRKGDERKANHSDRAGELSCQKEMRWIIKAEQIKRDGTN